MAMVGNPPIVFLDEPSTGMDPKAKRFMWSIISKISTLRKKSTVILTTHSMEEAEALCTKIGIMVNGKFKCYGSSQHIKDKFGTGYELDVKVVWPTKEDAIKLLATTKLVRNLEVEYDSLKDVLRELKLPHLATEDSYEALMSDLENEGPENIIDII
jgi:ATP-binding cassette subfamily A (ABC1) protein 3